MAKIQTDMDLLAQFLLRGDYPINLTLNQKRILMRENNHKCRIKQIKSNWKSAQ